MRSLKIELISTVRRYCLATGGRPTIVVHRKTCLDNGGHVPQILGMEIVMLFRIGDNAVRSYYETDHEILFESTFDGRPIKCVVPAISIVAAFDANNLDNGISFDLIREIEQQQQGLQNVGGSVSSILERYKKL